MGRGSIKQVDSYPDDLLLAAFKDLYDKSNKYSLSYWEEVRLQEIRDEINLRSLQEIANEN